ncbi:MAG: phosphate-starvation-inducible PsiE family protein [Actinomycetota bacterium]|nr:phosphate-starvation-inducible PsiE family protein [Actinomycetota bacterium]
MAGLALFVHSIYRFAAEASEGPFVPHVLELLDGLLLVFIVAELLHTVRALFDRNVLATEPFLIIGIVAAIRRLLVISAEAPDFLGEARFRDLMLEMGILIAAVLALGLTIMLMRRGERT